MEWQEYRLDEIFDNIVQGRRLKKQDQIPGNLPFVMSGTTDAGISGYVGNDVRVFPKNSLTVDIFGNVFFRNYEYGMGDDTGAYWDTENNISKSSLIYIATAMRKSLNGQFDFGSKLRSSRSLELKIQLPTVNQDGRKTIAFDYIEHAIKLLEEERIVTLEEERDLTISAYLSTTRLDKYILTEEEQAALNRLETINWGRFKIEDILDWQMGIKELNPLDLDLLSVSKEEKYPFYGQATINNGIIEYRHLKDEVLNNKLGKPTILIHSNNQNIVYLETPFYLKDGHGATSVLQSKCLDKMTAQFLMGSIEKVISQKYEYNAKATKIELKNSEIELPIKPDCTPDYEYMSIVITAIQKSVIKDIALSAEQKIMATKKVINYGH
ncbi:restriction endonuclease subunit S [Vibrio cyclitrophicus]